MAVLIEDVNFLNFSFFPGLPCKKGLRYYRARGSLFFFPGF